MPSEGTIFRVCSYLRNWFDYGNFNYHGSVTISNGALSQSYGLNAQQYFRIIGSRLNDGVYQYPVTILKDEIFEGSIIGMSIPKPVIDVMEKIEDWENKYFTTSSVAMSPFSSESIPGVFSYSKSTGANDTTKDKSGTWQGIFGAELAPWRKI